jgi:hypothetical protein
MVQLINNDTIIITEYKQKHQRGYNFVGFEKFKLLIFICQQLPAGGRKIRLSRGNVEVCGRRNTDHLRSCELKKFERQGKISAASFEKYTPR